MKKLLAVFLSVAMVLSLAACGGDSGSDKKDTKAADATQAAGDTKAAEDTKAANESGSAASGDTIKIGLMVSFTGSGVQAGEECQALAKIFEDIINNKHDGVSLPFAADEGLPGLGGAKIEFVVGDQSTADIALSEAERLITEEGVIGLCGNFSSATTKTAMVAAEKYGVPVISEGTSMSLTEAAYTYFGRSFPSDDVFIDDSFSYLDHLNETQNAEIKTICLISEDSEFGTNIAKVEAEAAAAHGYDVIENISYNKDATNVTSEVLRAKQANADVVMMSSYAADALLFMQEFKTQDYFPKMLFGQRGGFMASDFAINLKNDADYVLTTSRWNADMDNAAAQEIAKLFKDDMGVVLLGDTLTSVWDGVLLAVAANQAGSTDGDAMRAVMAEGLDLDPALDPFGLEGYKYPEKHGQNEFGKAIVLQYKGGELGTVYPEGSAELMYPAKGWNER
jgi:branched-chain amino acid transport system substrate-binding protein